MTEFPTEEVEAIIREEMLREQKTKRWTSPYARCRYVRLLTKLVVRRPDREGLLALLGRNSEARRELAFFCTDRPHIIAFQPDASKDLLRVLTMVKNAISETLAMRAQWPADTPIPHTSGESFLCSQVDTILTLRIQAEKAFRNSATARLKTENTVFLDQALQSCHYLLLTASEARKFEAHYNRAQAMLRQYDQMFHLPDDTPVH